MSSEEEYFTTESQQQAKIKIKGSRFIGTVSPANTIPEAEQFINSIIKKYYNATHNCYAYRIRTENQIISKSYDAGEPSGTAGQPILNVITGRDLLNVVVVVTRYFGGTKLGKGGLIRAYSECTQAVLDKALIDKKYVLTSLKISFPYGIVDNVMHIISKMNLNIKSFNYDQQTQLEIDIPPSLIDNFKNKLINATSGKVKFITWN